MKVVEAKVVEAKVVEAANKSAARLQLPDVWRRDFTANGLYYNIEDFLVWDIVGGVEDVRARRASPRAVRLGRSQSLW